MTSSIKNESKGLVTTTGTCESQKEGTMAEIKTTQKDLFARIMTVMADDAEVVALCENKIAQIERNAARPRKARVNEEVVKFRADVLEYLRTDAPDETTAKTNKELAEYFGVSAQKMSAALRFLVAEGTVIRMEGEKKSAPARFYSALVTE